MSVFVIRAFVRKRLAIGAHLRNLWLELRFVG